MARDDGVGSVGKEKSADDTDLSDGEDESEDSTVSSDEEVRNQFKGLTVRLTVHQLKEHRCHRRNIRCSGTKKVIVVVD